MAEILSSTYVACAVSDLRKPGGLKWCADLRIRLHQRIFGQGVAFVRLTNDRYFPLAVFVGFWPFIPFFDGIKSACCSSVRQTVALCSAIRFLSLQPFVIRFSFPALPPSHHHCYPYRRPLFPLKHHQTPPLFPRLNASFPPHASRSSACSCTISNSSSLKTIRHRVVLLSSSSRNLACEICEMPSS